MPCRRDDRFSAFRPTSPHRRQQDFRQQFARVIANLTTIQRKPAAFIFDDAAFDRRDQGRINRFGDPIARPGKTQLAGDFARGSFTIKLGVFLKHVANGGDDFVAVKLAGIASVTAGNADVPSAGNASVSLAGNADVPSARSGSGLVCAGNRGRYAKGRVSVASDFSVCEPNGAATWYKPSAVNQNRSRGTFSLPRIFLTCAEIGCFSFS